LETNVTKVTKIKKDPKEYYSTSTSLLHKTNSFSFQMNSFSNFENQNKNNFYSNKSLKFKTFKNIDMNKDENIIANNDEEDGFSPYMKNGSINIDVSLKNNNNPKNISSFNQNYSNSIKISNLKTQIQPNLIKNMNLYPMDNTSKEIIKGPIKQNIYKSNLLNPNRISIVKLKNENISSFPKNSNLQNNQTKSYLPFNMNNSSNGNIINYNFYQINNNRQFNNIFY